MNKANWIIWNHIFHNRLRAALNNRCRTRKVMTEYYREIREREPDFENPRDLSEYIMAGIINRRNDKNAYLADKIAVRDWVVSKGLGDILPEVYGVWKRALDIDLDVLPERFVLKTNHGSRFTIVCNGVDDFDIAQAAVTLDIWRKLRFSPMETHYSKIKPLIFAEEYIDDGSGNLPTDYKFMCVKGEPAMIIACTDRNLAAGYEGFFLFDNDWNYLSDYARRHPRNPEKVVRPKNLERMVEYARILSSDLDFVRVDLYDTGDKVYFGEMTLTPYMGKLDPFSNKGLEYMYSKL